MAAAPPNEPGHGDDAFPTQRFTALLTRLPRYARLAWGLAGEPRLSRTRRAALVGAAAYLVSPVDLVPGVIPVVGIRQARVVRERGSAPDTAPSGCRVRLLCGWIAMGRAF